MKLNSLFNNAPDIEIEQLSTDSRLPMKNAIFFCLDGIKYDGHNFIDEAISNGAKVIIYSKEIANKKGAIYVRVKNVNETLNKIANVFYNNPNDGICKYLISGCYGRSSVSEIIKFYLNKVNSCASIGTFGINYKDRHLDIAFPALTPLENLKYLDTFKKNHINNVVFETSAISLFYKKFDVVKPDIFVYTTTSKYCSDYKVCNNSYFDYIRKYMYTLENNTITLLNRDDESYDQLKDCIENVRTYGINNTADYHIKNVQLQNSCSDFVIEYNNNEYRIKTKLLGIQNVYNITAAVAALHINNNSIEDIINTLSDLDYIDGVMERIDDKYNVIVDCGFELDSLNLTMQYAKNVCKGNLIGIIGINYSDSDSTVKSVIETCEKYLDKIILTEDETQQAEVMNILSRADKFSKTKKIIHVAYRGIAIENAINLMNSDDTLLILGKGNEKFLSMGLGKERYLGDKNYALRYIKKRKEEENETSEIY